MITLTWNSLGILVSVLNYAAWPFLLPAFQYCHPGQISLSSVLWFHLSFPSANWFDKVFSRWQIQFSESDEYSRKKKKTSMIYAPMSFACLSHILKSEAGGSASLSECRSLFAGTWYRLTFFDTSYFCQENGVKENVSVNIGFARLLTVHILKFLYAGSGKDLNLMFPRKDRYVLRI